LLQRSCVTGGSLHILSGSPREIRGEVATISIFRGGGAGLNGNKSLNGVWVCWKEREGIFVSKRREVAKGGGKKTEIITSKCPRPTRMLG